MTNDNTSPAASPGVCPRCAGTHAEGDAETGERLPCTACFGMPLRPAGLDLDDNEVDLTAPIAPMEPREAEAWLAEIDAARGDCDPGAEVRAGYRIEAALRGVLQQRASRDASARAFDDLVAQVWRVAGEEHEPPASTEALVSRVAEEHKALVGFRAAMLDVHEALDGVRPEPDFDMPAELGSYACEEVARLKTAALPVGHVAVDHVLYDAACRLAADVPRLQREVAAARREGAEAMREACAAHCTRRAEVLDADAVEDCDLDDPAVAEGYARFAEAVDLAERIRALPLPGGEP